MRLSATSNFPRHLIRSLSGARGPVENFTPASPQAVFEGELVRDHIAGTFTSRRDADAPTPVTGGWFADRQPE
jgi:hypothetical protein